MQEWMCTQVLSCFPFWAPLLRFYVRSLDFQGSDVFAFYFIEQLVLISLLKLSMVSRYVKMGRALS